MVAFNISDRAKILDHILIKGYDTIKPSWKVIPHAMISAFMFHGSYISLLANAEHNQNLLL